MPTYTNDITHCAQTRCKQKDKCYRYWLGQEIKNTGWRYAYYYRPTEVELNGDCNFFTDIKNY